MSVLQLIGDLTAREPAQMCGFNSTGIFLLCLQLYTKPGKEVCLWVTLQFFCVPVLFVGVVPFSSAWVPKVRASLAQSGNSIRLVKGGSTSFTFPGS